MQTFYESLLGLYREELVTYETARDAATTPTFDLKVKGIFSTGEITWNSSSDGLEASKPAGRQVGVDRAPGVAERALGRCGRGAAARRAAPGNGGSWTRRPPSWRPSSFWRAKRGARAS